MMLGAFILAWVGGFLVGMAVCGTMYDSGFMDRRRKKP